MKAIMLYTPNSEHGTAMEGYVRDFRARRDPRIVIQLTSTETKEGSETAKLYDIVRYPALVVVRETGEPVKVWQGDEEMPPLMDELAGYLAA